MHKYNTFSRGVFVHIYQEGFCLYIEIHYIGGKRLDSLCSICSVRSLGLLRLYWKVVEQINDVCKLRSICTQFAVCICTLHFPDCTLEFAFAVEFAFAICTLSLHLHSDLHSGLHLHLHLQEKRLIQDCILDQPFAFAVIASFH